jgi:hypothetical protein
MIFLILGGFLLSLKLQQVKKGLMIFVISTKYLTLFRKKYFDIFVDNQSISSKISVKISQKYPALRLVVYFGFS